jgi:hypothetical protein
MPDPTAPQLHDNVQFLTDMVIMSGASSRLAFITGVEQLEESLLSEDSAVVENVRNVLRTVVGGQVEMFSKLLDRIDKSQGRRLA